MRCGRFSLCDQLLILRNIAAIFCVESRRLPVIQEYSDSSPAYGNARGSESAYINRVSRLRFVARCRCGVGIRQEAQSSTSPFRGRSLRSDWRFPGTRPSDINRALVSELPIKLHAALRWARNGRGPCSSSSQQFLKAQIDYRRQIKSEHLRYDQAANDGESEGLS